MHEARSAVAWFIGARFLMTATALGTCLLCCVLYRVPSVGSPGQLGRVIYFYGPGFPCWLWFTAHTEEESSQTVRGCLGVASRLLHFASHFSLFASFYFIFYDLLSACGLSVVHVQVVAGRIGFNYFVLNAVKPLTGEEQSNWVR